MIRFIDLGTQTGLLDENEGGTREFAFYNTVTSSFVGLADSQVWASWSDFESDYKIGMNAEHAATYPLERFKGLCPDWVPQEGLED